MEWTKFDWFVLGAVLGYAWHPVWHLIKKICVEAKKATEEWKNPNGKPD